MILFVYQTALVSPSHEEYDLLVDNMRLLIEDGQGETIFEVGTGGKHVVHFKGVE